MKTDKIKTPLVGLQDRALALRFWSCELEVCILRQDDAMVQDTVEVLRRCVADVCSLFESLDEAVNK